MKGLKRVWLKQNRCSNSMKEMGPGAQHDTLDDQLGVHNWHKIAGLCESVDLCNVLLLIIHLQGHSLHAKLVLVSTQADCQRIAHEKFTAALLEEQDWARYWTAVVKAWEKNDKLPNPYFHAVQCKYCLSDCFRTMC